MSVQEAALRTTENFSKFVIGNIKDHPKELTIGVSVLALVFFSGLLVGRWTAPSVDTDKLAAAVTANLSNKSYLDKLKQAISTIPGFGRFAKSKEEDTKISLVDAKAAYKAAKEEAAKLTDDATPTERIAAQEKVAKAKNVKNEAGVAEAEAKHKVALKEKGELSKDATTEANEAADFKITEAKRVLEAAQAKLKEASKEPAQPDDSGDES